MTLHEHTLTELVALLDAGELTCEEVTRSFLERIERLDPTIGAFLDPMTEAALSRARKLDALPRGARGPLHGAPIAVKDIISVAGTRCTCGSRILENYVPVYDAGAVERLRGAGAVFVGKTNMDEFAMGSSNENSALGKTRNPWSLEHVPGGSSGGSAAAVAAREVSAAIGSDTGGSIRLPASLCGVVGLKPTYGRVSRYGLVAFASSFDQIGPMTRNVEDAALLLESVAGHDPRDSTSVDRAVPRYRDELERDPAGLKIGVPWSVLGEGLDDDVRARLEAAIETFESMGVEIQEMSLPDPEEAIACYYLLVTAEASSNLARYDGVRYGLRSSPEGTLREMMRATRARGFGPEVKRRILLGTFVLSEGYYDAYYEKAQKVRSLFKNELDRAFERVSAVLLPTSPSPAFRFGDKVDDPLAMYLTDIFTITANLSGAPSLSLPAGLSSEKLPVGVQLMGRRFEEGTLLRLGHFFQQATDFHRKAPPVALS